MADIRYLSSGLAGCCKEAWNGNGLPGCEGESYSTPRPPLPPDIVRIVDAMARQQERREWLLALNGGILDMTLRDAAQAGGVQDVCFLLAAGADINYAHGSAIAWAASGGYLAVVTTLLDRGAGFRGNALAQAAGGDQAHVVALLLDRGVDVHHNNDAALRAAARYGSLRAARVLLASGADPGALDGAAAAAAKAHGHEDMLHLLMMEDV